jgi:hypothetical protein
MLNGSIFSSDIIVGVLNSKYFFIISFLAKEGSRLEAVYSRVLASGFFPSGLLRIGKLAFIFIDFAFFILFHY